MAQYKLLLFERNDQLIKDITQQVIERFNVTPKIEYILIGSLPKYLNNEGKTIYNLDQYKNYKLITDYWPIRRENVITVEDIDDIEYMSEVIAGFYLEPTVYFTDETEMALKMLNRLPDIFSYDCETLGLKIEDRGQYTMHSFSLKDQISFVLIDTPEIRQMVLDFLTRTGKKIICHNLAFDMVQCYYHTGKHFKNYEDTQLLAQAYLNRVEPIQYGLKSLAGHVYGDWATEKSSFNLYEDSTHYQNDNLIYKGSNPDWKKYNLSLVYYAGIDTIACKFLWDKYSAYHPEWESVDIEDLLPIVEPRYHEETPRFFYENVMKPIIPDIVELLETPMPINIDTVHKIKDEAETSKTNAYLKLRSFDRVKEYMEKDIALKIEAFLEPLLLKQKQEPTKVYKGTPKDRTILVNHILGESREKWNIIDIKNKIKELNNENLNTTSNN